MKSTRGRQRALSDAQVQKILRWNAQMQEWKEERKKVPTLIAFARVNRMSERTLSRWLPNLDRKIEELVRVREWHLASGRLLEVRARMGTQRGLARKLGVSDTTIRRVIQINGEYKQPSPELRDEARAERRVRLERLRRINLY